MSSAKPAAPNPPPRRTRERILDVARDLFNERGPDGVTTAEIARGAAINEGNLYYHFRRKEDLLEALFERFSAELLGTAALPDAAEAEMERYRLYLDGWFKIMWEWRFFYRDGAGVFRLAPGLRTRLREVSDEGIARTRQALDRMVEDGLLEIGPERLDRLIVNAWIVAAHWIEHLRSRHGILAPTREEIEEGAEQVLSLLLPYLTERGAVLQGPPTR